MSDRANELEQLYVDEQGFENGMTDALNLIHQIVEAEPFILNDAVVERVLNLLVEAIAEAGREGVVVKVPGLGVFDATDFKERPMFRFYAA